MGGPSRGVLNSVATNHCIAVEAQAAGLWDKAGTHGKDWRPDAAKPDFRELDPIFRNNDGTNCEGEDISTLSKRRMAFSLLLNKGLIRVGLDVPHNAEFMIVSVDDPYHSGMSFDRASMYRRPLATTNLKWH